MPRSTLQPEPPRTAIPLPLDSLVAFCQRWKITTLSLFGAVLTERLEPDDEVGVFLDWAADAGHSLFEWGDMKDELEVMFARPVLMATPRSMGLRDNPFFRKTVLEGSRQVYAL